MHTSYERLRNEFLEMPGLRLTAAQARRLCGLDLTACQAALAALVDARFLRRAADGSYARLTEGSVPPAHPANATRRVDDVRASTL